MLPVNLALISLTPSVTLGDVAIVSAALQKQLVRDFGPIWGVEASIAPFARLQDAPLGYWPIMVVDTFSKGGQHRDRNNQPYALVAAGSSWSLVASHEMLEMLVDPFGNRLIPGQSPIEEQGRVEFLVEVCDPCQGDAFGYTVNGVIVSDFYTPNYFDPVGASGTRYSYTGAIPAPRDVLAGGYLSWRNPVDGIWFQHHKTGAKSTFKNLGKLRPGANSLRAMIDARTPETRALANLPRNNMAMRRVRQSASAARAGAEARAAQLSTNLAGLDPSLGRAAKAAAGSGWTGVPPVGAERFHRSAPRGPSKEHVRSTLR
jgi:hypothetical protein